MILGISKRKMRNRALRADFSNSPSLFSTRWRLGNYSWRSGNTGTSPIERHFQAPQRGRASSSGFVGFEFSSVALGLQELSWFLRIWQFFSSCLECSWFSRAGQAESPGWPPSYTSIILWRCFFPNFYAGVGIGMLSGNPLLSAK